MHNASPIHTISMGNTLSNDTVGRSFGKLYWSIEDGLNTRCFALTKGKAELMYETLLIHTCGSPNILGLRMEGVVLNVFTNFVQFKFISDHMFIVIPMPDSRTSIFLCTVYFACSNGFVGLNYR